MEDIEQSNDFTSNTNTEEYEEHYSVPLKAPSKELNDSNLTVPNAMKQHQTIETQNTVANTRSRIHSSMGFHEINKRESIQSKQQREELENIENMVLSSIATLRQLIKNTDNNEEKIQIQDVINTIMVLSQRKAKQLRQTDSQVSRIVNLINQKEQVLLPFFFHFWGLALTHASENITCNVFATFFGGAHIF